MSGLTLYSTGSTNTHKNGKCIFEGGVFIYVDCFSRSRCDEMSEAACVRATATRPTRRQNERGEEGESLTI